MSAFFYTCPKYRDFRLLCTASQAGEDHFVLHDCLACGEQHLIDSKTRHVAARARRPAEPVRQLAAAAS